MDTEVSFSDGSESVAESSAEEMSLVVPSARPPLRIVSGVFLRISLGSGCLFHKAVSCSIWGVFFIAGTVVLSSG